MNLDLAPDKVTEQRALINTIRDEFERLPIEVTFSLGTFDVDCDEINDEICVSPYTHSPRG